jgi:hypothetical protein
MVDRLPTYPAVTMQGTGVDAELGAGDASICMRVVVDRL